MSSREKRDKRRNWAKEIRRNNFICPNCGERLKEGESGHFAPPSMGEEGFWICKSNTYDKDDL